ncbi:MAG: glycerol-3-phosphate 1-O-acyltransferase PlsY [Lachnospiraceae bacterium]|nr:glycerol-3-phosphate 1-O-acyltransferase PlsY [Lachnospiraceae bacterium]
MFAVEVLVRILVCIVVGYILGNFSTGYIVSKIYKVDIRAHGSGNVGTTNAFRTMGKKAGIITFIGDFLKVFIPLLLMRYVIYPDLEYLELLMLVLGFGCVLGHNFPFLLGFKGGKGIAVTSGVFLAFDYRILIPGVLIFALICIFTKYVSVASLTISLLFPCWIAVTRYFDIRFLASGIRNVSAGTLETRFYAAMVFTGILFFLSALIRHLPNIKRLKAGTENKIGQHAE